MKNKKLMKAGKIMGKGAREMAGVDVDHLLGLLVNNAAAQLTTYYYYTILRVNWF